MPVIPQAIRTRLSRATPGPMATARLVDTTSPNGMATSAPRTTRTNSTGRRAMPVAVRLVVTYGLIVAATLLVVAGVAYDLTRHQLATDLDPRPESAVGSFERGALRNLPSQGDLAARAERWLAEQVVVSGGALAVRTAHDRVLSAP